MAALKCMFSSFEEINNNLETYLSYDNQQNTRILGLLKDVFKHNKKDEVSGQLRVKECPLNELDTTEDDHELIWQQIQLQNEALLTQTDKKLKKILKDKSACLLNKTNKKSIDDDVINNINHQHDDDDEESEDMINNEDMVNDDDMINNDHDISDDDIDHDMINKNNQNNDRPMKSSIVDDQFFKLSEMEKFLEMQEKQGSDNDNAISDDENDYDLFQDYNQDNDDELRSGKENDPSECMYKDFFDTPVGVSDTTSKVKKSKEVEKNIDQEENVIEDELSVSDAEETVNADKNNKSTHEKQQEKIQKKISQLEESNIASKPWQLGGETTGSVRPSNSLLEEMVYFDHTTAAAPVVTEETTLNLEDIIKQRIKDQTWDDVERKEKPMKEAYEYVKNKPLNQEKSKMSLSEIYEKEYLTQTGPTEEKKNEEHEEIKKMMSKLFAKLDALSNYHFTPKPPKTEVTIVANVGSVTIEEAIPVNVSTTKLLAPEEIFDKQKQELKSATEETKEDRKQKRRIKKKKQQLAAKRREEKSGLGNKYTKEKMKKRKDDVEHHDSKSFTSSSAFFAKLRDSVQNEIHGKKNDSAKKRKEAIIQPEKIKL